MSTLSEYLKKAGVTQADFAAEVGVVQATISRLARGELPSLGLALRIERATNGDVPANSWGHAISHGPTNKAVQAPVIGEAS